MRTALRTAWTTSTVRSSIWAPDSFGLLPSEKTLSSSASAPACSMSLAYSSQPPSAEPFSEPITGTSTACFTRRRCSRYSSGPRWKASGFGKKLSASAKDWPCDSVWTKVATCSRVICSSKIECITMAAAPASSSLRTVSRSSTRGEAPGISGWGSFRPR